MSKKTSGKVIQMLSPENYIRTKARTLPIYECWINTGWEEVKQAGCIVSRKHNNGNISYCFYLVDLLCLGVKHTHFAFNESVSHYKDFLVQAEEEVSLELVDYSLVHNVIHAGIEFAEEFEFKPYKDFTKVTQYFLEEDNDDIELMEIECGGEVGHPVYIHSSKVTTAQEKDRIIAQLERTAGPDNYTLIDEDDDFDENDFDDDFDDQEINYRQNTSDENRVIFTRLFRGMKDSDDPNDLISLTEVTNALFLQITDTLLVNQYYDELFDSHSIHVETEEIVKELLGVKPEVEINIILIDMFLAVFKNILKNMEKARQGAELLRKEAPELPAVAFLELLILQKESPDKYTETLQKYVLEYPDYPMINLMWLNHIYASENVPEEISNKTFNLDTLFPGRNSLHFLEMFYYLTFISNVVAHEANASKIEAFYQVLDEFDLPEEAAEKINDSFSLLRIEYLAEKFNLEIEW